jgi:tRNA A37 threonylcarbamoyladenosine biosynthesis protein TsaE
MQIPGDHDIVLIEWPERAGHLLPADRWLVSLSVPPGEPHLRAVEVTRVGEPRALASFPLAASSA